MKRLISSDPLTGSATYFHHDSSSNTFRIENIQDVTDIVEQNKIAQTDGNNGWSKSREFKYVGNVPILIMHQWAMEAGVALNSKEFGEVLKKKLNDPDFRAFRTGLGQV